MKRTVKAWMLVDRKGGKGEMSKSLIHAIADCSDCKFVDEYYLTAQKSGRQHHLKTGHRVILDLGYYMEYERRKP